MATKKGTRKRRAKRMLKLVLHTFTQHLITL